MIPDICMLYILRIFSNLFVVSVANFLYIFFRVKKKLKSRNFSNYQIFFSEEKTETYNLLEIRYVSGKQFQNYISYLLYFESKTRKLCQKNSKKIKKQLGKFISSKVLVMAIVSENKMRRFALKSYFFVKHIFCNRVHNSLNIITYTSTCVVEVMIQYRKFYFFIFVLFL